MEIETQSTRLDVYLDKFVNWIFDNERDKELLKQRNVKKHVEENEGGKRLYSKIINKWKVKKPIKPKKPNKRVKDYDKKLNDYLKKVKAYNENVKKYHIKLKEYDVNIRQYYRELYRAVKVRNEYNKYIKRKSGAFVKILGVNPSMAALYNLSELEFKTRYETKLKL